MKLFVPPLNLKMFVLSPLSVKMCVPRLPVKTFVLSHLRDNCLFLSKVFFFQMLSPVNGLFPSNVIFCQRSYSVKGRLMSRGIFHQRLSSIKGCLPSKVVFRQSSRSKVEWSRRFQNTLEPTIQKQAGF